MEFKIKLQKFEGPLDLLLYLIRKAKIDIYDIPICEITEQYLNYLGLMKKFDIEVASEFILMTATLIYIKSKMLLPTEAEMDEEFTEDPRKELVEQLLEYQKFRMTALKLEEKEIFQEDLFFRKPAQMMIDFKDEENWVEVTVFDLINAFSRIVEFADYSQFIQLIPEEITVNMKIEEIMKRIEINYKFYFTDLFLPSPPKYEIVVTFLAILELVKSKIIKIQQHQLFGDIRIIKNEVKNG